MEEAKLVAYIKEQRATGATDPQIFSELKSEHSNLYSEEELGSLMRDTLPPKVTPNLAKWTRVLTTMITALLIGHVIYQGFAAYKLYLANETNLIPAVVLFLVMEIVFAIYLRNKAREFDRKAYLNIFWVGVYLLLRFVGDFIKLKFNENAVMSDVLLMAAHIVFVAGITGLSFWLYGKLWPQFTVFGKKKVPSSIT